MNITESIVHKAVMAVKDYYDSYYMTYKIEFFGFKAPYSLIFLSVYIVSKLSRCPVHSLGYFMSRLCLAIINYSVVSKMRIMSSVISPWSISNPQVLSTIRSQMLLKQFKAASSISSLEHLPFMIKTKSW